MPTPEIHSNLPASSSGRWLHCTPSAMLAAQAPSETSVYAEAGRIAHAIGEWKIRNFFGLRCEWSDIDALRSMELYDRGMEEATDEYLEAVQTEFYRFDEKPFLSLETRVDYSDVAEGGFGTADCILIGGDTITIMDYKNGSGVSVEAENNTQMMLYAYGALRDYAIIYGDTLKIVNMVIVQPHSGGVKRWSMTTQALRQWANDVVKPAAALAAKGEGQRNAGPWCDNYFCPARATCRARAEMLLKAAEPAPALPPELTDEEVGEVLKKAAGLEKWLSALKDYAMSKVLDGGTIPGFKVVEGRGSRDWSDDAFKTIQERGLPEAMLWERKPVSVAGLEKALGKKAFAEVAEGLWEKKPGKPALVPETDKRPPYNKAAAAFGGAENG